MKICILFLTCANSEDADTIAQSLLEKKLVFCVKKLPVSSSFLWQRKIDHSDEVLLMMDSVEENFEKIKTEVAKHHSYKTFVLLACPISHTTKDVKEWMKKELAK
jgi:periplasmic divalent cation tolerance protein